MSSSSLREAGPLHARGGRFPQRPLGGAATSKTTAAVAVGRPPQGSEGDGRPSIGYLMRWSSGRAGVSRDCRGHHGSQGVKRAAAWGGVTRFRPLGVVHDDQDRRPWCSGRHCGKVSDVPQAELRWGLPDWQWCETSLRVTDGHNEWMRLSQSSAEPAVDAVQGGGVREGVRRNWAPEVPIA